jgi:hypothetical protein
VRDWQKDLELCDKATPGPWIQGDKKYQKLLGNSSMVFKPTVRGNGVNIKFISQIDGRYQDKDETNNLLWITAVKDAKFIAESREGWPAALRRVIELEAENERLRDMLRRIERGTESVAACPVCGKYIGKISGHSDDCELAALLSGDSNG